LKKNLRKKGNHTTAKLLTTTAFGTVFTSLMFQSGNAVAIQEMILELKLLMKKVTLKAYLHGNLTDHSLMK
jgi:hypothetical protein